jgi:hypothetical protein
MLSALKKLENFRSSGPGFTDAALKHLHGMKSLKVLDIRKSPASKAAIEELKKALPKRKVTVLAF